MKAQFGTTHEGGLLVRGWCLRWEQILIKPPQGSSRPPCPNPPVANGTGLDGSGLAGQVHQHSNPQSGTPLSLSTFFPTHLGTIAIVEGKETLIELDYSPRCGKVSGQRRKVE
ncbi:hypothetical protein ZHAS_00008178 [Anopheles sinensis]|uniref:Uncharacterized protein n=1 Tax=Anopheles sinensis TaxID=74873 RepID=A0A084VRP2_ANOSI|nr:hypothetical protein ZHAS_00008178 [Anopheles sinensis]